MTPEHQPLPDLGSRVSGLERDVAHLDDRIDAFEKTVGRRFDQLAYSIENLGKSFNEGRKTPWATLAAWAGVVVMLVAILGHGYVRDLNRVEATHDQLQKTYYEYVVRTAAENASLRARVEALESK
jgi:hypothetical protein